MLFVPVLDTKCSLSQPVLLKKLDQKLIFAGRDRGQLCRGVEHVKKELHPGPDEHQRVGQEGYLHEHQRTQRNSLRVLQRNQVKQGHS